RGGLETDRTEADHRRLTLRRRAAAPRPGPRSASAMPDVHVVHAGTAVEGEEIVTAGGRVLAVVALGDTLAQARDAAYEGVRAITWEGAQYRTDIALKAAQEAITVPELRG
ncbi:MAG: phosphoribosylglycinamide synthetase C domain-containing protein, partial [Rothia aeria]